MNIFFHISMIVAMLFCLLPTRAEEKPVVRVNGTQINKSISNISFIGDTVELQYDDNSTEHVDMSQISIIFCEVSSSGIGNIETKSGVRMEGNMLCIDNVADGVAATVYNSSGKLVKKTKTVGNSLCMDVSQLQQGVYLLKIAGKTYKFMKTFSRNTNITATNRGNTESNGSSDKDEIMSSNRLQESMPVVIEASAAHDVEFNAEQNQVVVRLKDGSSKYFDTGSLSSIDFNGTTVNLAFTDNDVNEQFAGSVSSIFFSKKVATSPNGLFSNSEGKVSIIEGKGWLESAYVKWNLMAGANGYNVYVKGGRYTEYTKIDNHLVRNYGTYARADVVGLASGSDYELKVVPVFDDEERAEAANELTSLVVRNYNREGYAHFGYTQGVGAYNNDGTLKNNARVLYVTNNTAKTVKCQVITSNNGNTTECTGIQSIIDAYQKGADKTPLSVRIIGMVKTSDMDKLSSSSEGLQIKGKAADSELNITIEGIGDDATIHGFGFLLRNAKSVEVRNLAVMQCMDDGISLDTDNRNIWIHHIDMFYGRNKGGDQKKGDGAIDVKANSKYVTIDNCRFWDTGKSSLCGMKSESGENWITYHHNWFDHSDSRHARVRTMSVHMYNNFFDNCAKYGVGATVGASVFVENNYFLKTKKPILSSMQGTDAKGSGTFSDEAGGMIKAYGNFFDRTIKNFSYFTQKAPASTGYDAYETDSRYEQVPEAELTIYGIGDTEGKGVKGQNCTAYNNFDTDDNLIYHYAPQVAEAVPAQVTGYYGAGRMNHGDVSFAFVDNVGNDDTDSEIITELESLINNYATKLVGIFGEENVPSGEQGGQGDQPTPDGTILCTFDKNGIPSSDFFIVSGNGSNSKGSVTIDSVTYSTCLKIESATSVKFTLSKRMKLTLYFADGETASMKINGTKINGSGSVYSLVLETGSYELTKDKSVNLFGIKLEPLD